MSRLCLVILIAFCGRVGLAQDTVSSYRGQETREIKALSVQEIESLEAGEGMGFAKAAELNRYPGPKHVLELGQSLALSDEQEARTRNAFERMREEAVALGAAIIVRERALDRMFGDRTIDEQKLETAVSEIAMLRGKLRLAHLKAHLEMEAVLTEDQIQRYVELRGYHDPSRHHEQKEHHR